MPRTGLHPHGARGEAGDRLEAAQTLPGALRALVELSPDFECLTFVNREGHETRVSLAALSQRAHELASAFSERGLQRQESVVLILPTGPDLVAAYFGTMLCGAVPALLAAPTHRLTDASLYAERVRGILENAEARILYCDDSVATDLYRHGAAIPSRTELVRPAETRGLYGEPKRAEVEPHEIATIQYSSGATGTPKGVLLSHRAMLNNLRAVTQGLEVGPGDVSVNWIPLYHDMGLIDGLLLPLLNGCPTILIPTMDFMREPAIWLRALARYRGTISFAPNFAYALCAHRIPDSDLADLDLSCLRTVTNGAEPVLSQTIEAFARRFEPLGCRPEAMTPIWGMAENVTVATAHPVSQPPLVEHLDPRRLSESSVARPTAAGGLPSVSVGRCLPGCEVEIHASNGARLPERSIGEIWLRSDSLFDAYQKDPALSQQALRAGWFRTGDRGYLADGNLFFVSREKDLIVIGGEKYAPHHVELAINRVHGVRQGCAIAFGWRNDISGTEELAAVVETKLQDSSDLEALRREIRTTVMETVGLPLRRLKLVPPGGVEKTTSGKLARMATRRRYAQELQDGR